MSGQLLIGEELTICNVADLYSELQSAAHTTQELVIDLSKVKQIDTAGLQLLIAAFKEARLLGARVSYNASAVVLNYAEKAGLTEQLICGGKHES